MEMKFWKDVYAKLKNIMVKQQNNLFILKYNKYALNEENVNTLGLFRSVVTDGSSLLAFSPPKSISFDSFKDKFCKGECIAEEFIEGTMINCFYYKDKWMIATRWDIGAHSSFYQDLKMPAPENQRQLQGPFRVPYLESRTLG